MNQSALQPLGLEASEAYALLVIMTICGGLILAGVVTFVALAIFGSENVRVPLSREGFIIGGGLVFPVVVLGLLLATSLAVVSGRASTGTGETMTRVSITGEMWWWRIAYELPDGTRFETANELRLPVGQPVELSLRTADVIHSFWAPALAGKLDMIPGRTNTMTVTATEEGTSRGQCAEYCGGAHAFMAFHVVSSSPEEFAVWSRKESGPSLPPSPDLDEETLAGIRAGAELFQIQGCGACHTVRGGGAFGNIGPDLTHVGGRLSLAAGTLPNDADAFVRWIANTQHIKPDNAMPQYDILSSGELAKLAAYLESLK